MKKSIVIMLSLLMLMGNLPCYATDIRPKLIPKNSITKINYVRQYKSIEDLWEDADICVVAKIEEPLEDGESGTYYSLNDIQILNKKVDQMGIDPVLGIYGEKLATGKSYLLFLQKEWVENDTLNLYNTVGSGPIRGIFQLESTNSGNLQGYTIKKYNSKNKLENSVIGKKLEDLMDGNLINNKDDQVNVRTIKEYPIRVVDKDNKPIANMYINGINPNSGFIGDNDNQTPKVTGFTNDEGIVTLKLAADCPIYVDSKPTTHSGDNYHTSDLPKKNGIAIITWTGDTPLERVNQAENGFRFRVVDKDGKPVPGLHITANRLIDIQLELKKGVPTVLEGYTDKDGYFCSLTMINGESFGDKLYIKVSETDGNREVKTKAYSVSTSDVSKNWYKLIWD